MGERIATLEREIFELAGHEFTIGSPQQLGEVLFDELGLTKKRRGKTGFSTDARVLAQIRDEHEIVAKVESWRELTKLKNTYLDALPELIDPETAASTRPSTRSRRPPGGSPAPTRTSRTSRSAPRGRPIRSCFVAEPGMRLLSARLQPGRAARARPRRRRGRAARDLRLGRGRARRDRRRGRRRRPAEVGLAASARRRRWSTTGSPTGSRTSGSPTASRSTARRPAPTSTATSSASRRSSGSSTRRSRAPSEDGYVTTLMGRRRRDPRAALGQRQRRSLGERLAVNTVIQGTAADIIKIAMVRCHAALAEAGLETRLVLQIHDELLFEGPEAEMERASELVARRDGRRLRPRPAARGRHRRRRGLAGGEVDRAARASRPWTGPRRAAHGRASAG